MTDLRVVKAEPSRTAYRRTASTVVITTLSVQGIGKQAVACSHKNIILIMRYVAEMRDCL